MPPPAPSMPLHAAGRALGAVFALGWLLLVWPALRALPDDAAAVAGTIALVAALAVGLGLARPSRWIHGAVVRPPTWAFLGGCCAVAVALSAYVVHAALRGRVLAVDSAVYVHEARALGHFALGQPVVRPGLPFAGRFLFEGADGRLHGVFPPGFPLYLAPFVRAGHALWAGPALAALLALAQYALGRVLFRDEWVARVAVLLSLPSFPRALETADLLSHAFVAALAAAALAAAVHLARGGRARWGLACGAALGWAVCARLLDGVVVAIAVAGVFVVAGITRRGVFRGRALPLVVLGALPFLALLAADQHAATGAWLRPTQAEFFARSDFPPTCHRLGFGRDVGCLVEHPGERRGFGPDGYTPDDAAGVMRERAGRLGRDLLGLSPLLVLALLACAVRPGGAALACAGFTLLLCLAYGLFYYGNAPLYGARHLFPAAPCVYALCAWAITRAPSRGAPGAGLDAARVRGAILFAVLAAGVAAQTRIARADIALAREWQAPRIDAREFIARHGIARGIVVTNDPLGALAGADPFADGERRFVVSRLGSYLHELLALHPELALHIAGADGQDRVLPPPPVRPGVLIELEAAWPSFQRVRGVGAVSIRASVCCRAAASDGLVLQAFTATPGGTLALAVDVARAGDYALRLAAIAGPSQGDWSVRLDGVELPTWHGYNPTFAPRSTAATLPTRVTAGAHTLVLTSVGRDPRSVGYGGVFDALIGEPAQPAP